ASCARRSKRPSATHSWFSPIGRSLPRPIPFRLHPSCGGVSSSTAATFSIPHASRRRGSSTAESGARGYHLPADSRTHLLCEVRGTLMTYVQATAENLKEAYSTVWRHRMLVVLAFGVFMSISVALIALSPRIYRAGASVLIVNGNA